MRRDVVDLRELDRSRILEVGGKAASLGKLSRISDVSVPPGFCVTTGAFERALAGAPGLEARIDRLAGLKASDESEIRALSAEIREGIEGIAVPEALVAEIRFALDAQGHVGAWAVRSSATAEDLPTASFAGQHDSTLHVVGLEAILRAVRGCWASLFSDRAVSYRLRSGNDRREAKMAVVIQRMVAAEAAGVLFTADPLTGHRKVSVVEAVPGLGEALVAGQVNPEVYEVRGGRALARSLTGPERVLSDAQVLEIAALGRRIEAWFGRPQDVEWCLAGGAFAIVQSRAITTLFPVPEARDRANHVYVSVGHGQMMTDAMKPLGLSLWQLTTPRPMVVAGSRLFVDMTSGLSWPASRGALLQAMGRSDPLMRDALETILDRGDFIASSSGGGPGGPPPGGAPAPGGTTPATVAELMARTEASVAALRREIGARSGPDLIPFIVADLVELKRLLFDPASLGLIMAAVEATWWLNDHLEEWLGERGAADPLAQSAPHNVTTEMGLALLDVADLIRPHPEVVAALEEARGDPFLDALGPLDGGPEARDAILGWLDRYGMRCVGEIDISRPRWAERPATLLPMLLGHVRNAEPGAARRRREQGLRAAADQERWIVERLAALPDGEGKAAEAAQKIALVRAYMGYREHPKYGMISRYWVYKQALLAEADRLVAAGVLADRDDIFELSLDELQAVVVTRQVDQGLIAAREEAFRWHQTLSPPRVLTSDGEALSGRYRRGGLPPGALAGLAVSAGVVEGRARVIFDLAEAHVEVGDILVTPFTDPSWTPLFTAIRGLVTEVGGLMTHGSVIAREYGLPAVVGVEHATRRIRDGQRVRVHGTEGYVEVIDEGSTQA